MMTNRISEKRDYGSLQITANKKGEYIANQQQQQPIKRELSDVYKKRRNDSFENNNIDTDNNDIIDERKNLISNGSNNGGKEQRCTTRKDNNSHEDISLSQNKPSGNIPNCRNERDNRRRVCRIFYSILIAITGWSILLITLISSPHIKRQEVQLPNNCCLHHNTTTATNNTISYDDIIDSIEYDYIVVGGGPSGIIVATRLAKELLNENPPGNVLLLESGTDSQSSVLKSVFEHQQKQLQQYILQQQRQVHDNSKYPRQEELQDKNRTIEGAATQQRQKQPQSPHQKQSSLTTVFSSFTDTGFVWRVSDGPKQLNLNQYDVPIMWSSIASKGSQIEDSIYSLKRNSSNSIRNNHTNKKDKNDTNNSNETTANQVLIREQERQLLSHHWPIKDLLLARGLGGCGLHNAMIYVRALPSDIVKWKQCIKNVEGWEWSKMLQYYEELETYDDTKWNVPVVLGYDKSSSSSSLTTTPVWFRGTNGPITTVPSGPAIDDIAPLFMQSALNAGLSLSNDGIGGFNNPNVSNRVGVGYYEYNIKNGVRDSIANTMLGHTKSIPSNLYIRTGSTVIKVLTTKVSSSSRYGTRKGGSDSKPQQRQPRAFGVKYFRINENDNNGQVRTAKLIHGSNNEGQIILSTGAIMTPQILYNSGIYKDGYVSNVPGVGLNLQDHPVVPIVFRITPELAERSKSIFSVAEEMSDYVSTVSQLNSMDEHQIPNDNTKYNNNDVSSSSLKQMSEEENLKTIQDVASHLGTMGTAGFSAGAFLRSPWASSLSEGDKNDDDIPPDIQITVFPRVIEPHVVAKLKGKDSTSGSRLPVESTAMLVTVALLQPDARKVVSPKSTSIDLMIESLVNQHHQGKGRKNKMQGTKRTKSTNLKIDKGDDNDIKSSFNYTLPSIEIPTNTSSYLSDLDIKRLVWGIEEIRRIRSFDPLSSNTIQEVSPGEQVISDTLYDYVKENHLENSHWVGSTKMGSLSDDPLAVVDERLRVRGVSNLRIIDAGIIPSIPNGNTHSTVCVVACHGSDLIIEERKNSSTK